MSPDYKNIIVAIDGSKTSEQAFKKALVIAKANQARLILTHVIDSRTFVTAGTYDKTLAEQANTHAKELLNQYVEKSTLAEDYPLEKCIEYGSPKVKIAKDIAKRYQADLIVCGATGLNAVERFLIGSVSESIMRYATCDVLIVR